MPVTIETVLERVDHDVQNLIHNLSPSMANDGVKAEAYQMILSLRRLRADFIKDGQMIHHNHIQRCSTYIQRLHGLLDQRVIVYPPACEEHLKQAGLS